MFYDLNILEGTDIQFLKHIHTGILVFDKINMFSPGLLC